MRVWGSGFRASGLRVQVLDCMFWAKGLGLWTKSLRFRVEKIGYEVQR